METLVRHARSLLCPFARNTMQTELVRQVSLGLMRPFLGPASPPPPLPGGSRSAAPAGVHESRRGFVRKMLHWGCSEGRVYALNQYV
jgi:hypothetical protein